MKRTLLGSALVGISLFAGLLLGACDSETTSDPATGGGGSSTGPACETHADCAAGTCAAGEAATTSCNDGACETTCEAGHVACSECTAPADCNFAGDLCPPPNTDPFQNCFEGRCSEFCGRASEETCLTDNDCPKVQCPDSAAPTAQCIGGGCVDVGRRCCEG